MKILWVPHAGWHIPQRAHLFCQALSERHDVHVTDWVADFKKPMDYLSTRYFKNFYYRRYCDKNITVHGIPRISPALFSKRLVEFNRKIYSYYVQRIINKNSIDAVVSSFVIPPPEAPRVFFDLFDDNVSYWQSYGPVSWYLQEIAANEKSYLETADVVIAASSVLKEKAEKLGSKHVVHIPNGVLLSPKPEKKLHPWIKDRLGINGKLVGMVGNHERWFEIELVIETARLLQNGNVYFLIAGRNTLIEAARKRVRQAGIDNVFFMGYIPPAEATEIVNSLDVGLCPYKKTPGADASSPMRLLLYASIGLPTVCTSLEEVRRMSFENVILVDDDPASFASGVKKALQMDKIVPEKLKNYELPLLVKKLEEVMM